MGRPKRAAAAKASEAIAETAAPPKKKAKAAKAKAGLDVGDDLPTFTVVNDADEAVASADLVKDCGIVLFAYPKANTPGCTNQAKGLNDALGELAAAGYKVYGISADKPAAQASWRAKHGLGFRLLCDPSYEVLARLGFTKGAKSIARSHIVVEKGGRVADVQVGVTPKDSVKGALAFALEHPGEPLPGAPADDAAGEEGADEAAADEAPAADAPAPAAGDAAAADEAPAVEEAAAAAAEEAQREAEAAAAEEAEAAAAAEEARREAEAAAAAEEARREAEAAAAEEARRQAEAAAAAEEARREAEAAAAAEDARREAEATAAAEEARRQAEAAAAAEDARREAEAAAAAEEARREAEAAAAAEEARRQAEAAAAAEDARREAEAAAAAEDARREAEAAAAAEEARRQAEAAAAAEEARRQAEAAVAAEEARRQAEAAAAEEAGRQAAEVPPPPPPPPPVAEDVPPPPPPPIDCTMSHLSARAAGGALLLVLLAAASTKAKAIPDVKLGADCGPEWFAGRWVAIPAASLQASAPSGVARADAAGCVTSDAGAGAHVSARLSSEGGVWHILEIRAKMKARASSDASLTITVGDVDLNAHLAKVRAGTVKLSEVMQHSDRCVARKLSALAGGDLRTYVFACNEEVAEASGSELVFSAPGLTVCDVRVCAFEQQFDVTGDPITRDAAMLLAAARPPRGGETRAAAGGLAFPAATPETCPGQDTAKVGSCPLGKVCQSTYTVGSCSCGHSSAFTKQASCHQGDTEIYLRPCCATCSRQPLCAVCVTPCVPEFVSVEVYIKSMPQGSDYVYTASEATYTSTSQAVNLGINPQTVTASFTFSQSFSATMTLANSYAHSEEVSASIGIPYIDSGNVKFTETTTITTTDATTKSYGLTMNLELPHAIPPLTMQVANATGKAGMVIARVRRRRGAGARPVDRPAGTRHPLTTAARAHAHARGVSCDKTETSDNELVIQNGAHAAARAGGSRPAVRLWQPAGAVPSPPAPRARPPDGVLNAVSSCSFCALRPACAGFAADNTTMCCPSITNVRYDCCGP
ncbi:bcp1 [Scenedesmus sp. PABB004]|nr:bcp1 [Scenedesmus sp. PABB004]